MALRGIVRYLWQSIRPTSKGLPAPGDAAPPFEATDHRGNPISLESLRGSSVVLWFFPRADTPG